MYFIDAHAHLSFFNPDQLKTVFSEAQLQNIHEWILAGYDSADWQKQLTLFEDRPQAQPCFGLHPWRVFDLSLHEIEKELRILETLLPQAKGCGETGIDGFRATEKADIEKQRVVFERHLELNKEFQLPLVLHIVQSHEIALQILKNYSYTGLAHGFSGSWETAKNYIKLGYKISIGRGIYEKGYKHLKDTAAKIDLKDFVIESDSFVSEDGVAEEPAAILIKVAKTLAAIKNVSVEKICLANYENVKSVFTSAV